MAEPVSGKSKLKKKKQMYKINSGVKTDEVRYNTLHWPSFKQIHLQA